MGPQEQAKQIASDEEAHARRLEALRELSESAASLSGEHGPTAARVHHVTSLRPRRRHRGSRKRAIALACALAFAFTIAAIAFRGLLPWQHPAAFRLSINLAAHNLYCPSSAAWAPDGSRLAVLAQFGACARDGNNTGQGSEAQAVGIFDLHGRLLRLLYPDSLALGADTTSGPASSATGEHVRYFGFSWSPTGDDFALPFEAQTVHTASVPPQQGFQEGVAILPADGSPGFVLSYHNLFAAGDVWDMRSRTLTNPGAPDLAPATAYTWSSGNLQPAASPKSDAPVGNPSGGASFTIWQPGALAMQRPSTAIAFSSAFAAWSPDGRYVAPGLGFGGVVAPSSAPIARDGSGNLLLAPRDSALAAVIAQVKASTDPEQLPASVAWRADGSRLAALVPSHEIDASLLSGLEATGPLRIAVYDCASGTRMTTLETTPPINRPNRDSGVIIQPRLLWSPDQSMLALLDTWYDGLTVWRFQ